MRIDDALLRFLESHFVRRRGNTAIEGSVVPAQTDTYLLGTHYNRWETIYARTVVADNIASGSGGGVNADTVDAFHAYSSPQPNSLLALDGTSRFPTSVYASALLIDGSRALEGNMAVDPGVTIDGVDISAHASSSDSHHAQLHGIVGADHTVTGSALDVIGLSATNTLAVLTPSSNPGATGAILRSASDGSLYLDTSLLGIDASADKIGIGITPATAKLWVQGTADEITQIVKGFSGQVNDIFQVRLGATNAVVFRVEDDGHVGVKEAIPGANVTFRVQETFSTLSATKYGTFNELVLNPTANIPGQSAISLQTVLSLAGSGGLTHGSTLYGIQNSINFSSASTWNTVIGQYVIFSHGNTIATTVNNETAFYAYMNVEDASVTTLTAFYGNPRIDTGSIGTFYGLRINPTYAGAGIMTTAYGVKIENITATNAWAIYTGAGRVYFGDNVGIKGSPSDLYRFYILNNRVPGGSTVYASYMVSAFQSTANDAGQLISDHRETTNSGATAGIDMGAWIADRVRIHPTVNFGTITGLSGYDLHISVDNTITGTVTQVKGGTFTFDIEDATATTLIGLQVGGIFGTSIVDTGSIGTLYGLRINPVSKGAGSITTAYGLYIGDHAVAGTNYSIYTGLGDLSLGDDIVFRQASSISTSAGNLSIVPAGDIIVDPTGNYVNPNTNYDINLGMISKKYLTLHAAELWVETLVAQDTIATIGGRVLVGPTTVLTSDFLSASTSMEVKHNEMVSGDIVYLEGGGKVEFITIASAPSGTGPYTYTVTRDTDGTGANDWYAGDAVFNTGQAGRGWIDLYSLHSMRGTLFDYIFVDDGTVFGSNQNNNTSFDLFPAVAVVDDALYIGVSNATWGNAFFYIGTAGSYTGVTFAYEYWNGSIWTALTTTGTPDFSTTGLQSLLFSSSQSGWATTTVNSQTAYWVRIRVSAVTTWTTSPKISTRRITGSYSHFGPTIVGNVRASSTFNDWKENWAIGNLQGLYGYVANTWGIGLGAYGDDHIVIDSTNGIRFRDASDNVISQWLGANLTLGLSTADHIYITSSAIQLMDNTVVKIELQTDGDIFIGSNISAVASTYLSVFANGQTYNTETMGAGDMLIGDNSSSKANILWDYSEGQLKFRGGQTTQVYIDTSGALTAGAGKVVLDSSGIRTLMPATTTVDAAFRIRNAADTTDYFTMTFDPAVGATQGGYLDTDTYPLFVNGLRVDFENDVRITKGLVVGSATLTAFEDIITLDEGEGGKEFDTGADHCYVYLKGDKLIIAFHDAGTTWRYKYLDLTGTGVTWQYSATEP